MLEPFKNITIENQTIYLVNHILIRQNSIDCIVDKNKIIIHANNAEYIFKRQTSSII
jgi:hypothetical protein